MPTEAGKLAGKLAVVTGASRGIGRAIAFRLAGAGAGVALIARSTAALHAVAAELRALPDCGLVLVAAADVADPDAVTAAADAIHAGAGAVDLLVNNAGDVLRRPLADTTDSEWRRVIAVNLDGCFHTIRAFADDLVARRGRIINIASISGRQGTALLSGYCAAKHGVVGLTRAMAEELRPAGVAVNAICPGSVDTEMLRRGLPDARPDMTPEEIAETAMFLAADAPAALTGSCIDVFG